MSNNFKRRDILHMGLAASALAALPPVVEDDDDFA